MADTQEEKRWDLTIKPVSGWFDIRVSELWKYRDLILLFVRRDFVSVHKQTIFGPLWFLIQPLIISLIFSFIFGKVAKIPTDGLPRFLFYMSGIVVWKYFADCIAKTSNTFISNANIFGKVYFPRLAIPISIIINNLVSFCIQFLLFLFFVLYFYVNGTPIRINGLVFLAPLFIFQIALLGMGFGIIVSSLTTKYRDLSQLVAPGIQLWMFASPIIYPASQLPENWQWLISINPIAPIIETFRFAFLGAGSVHLWQIGISVLITFLIFFSGIVLFSRIEKSFLDTV